MPLPFFLTGREAAYQEQWVPAQGSRSGKRGPVTTGYKDKWGLELCDIEVARDSGIPFKGPVRKLTQTQSL